MEHRFLLCFFNFDFSISGCIRSWLWRVEATLQLWCSGFSLQWHLLLQSTGFSSCSRQPQYLRPTSSVVVAHGLSCLMACGIFPDQGSNLRPALVARFFFKKAFYFIFAYSWLTCVYVYIHIQVSMLVKNLPAIQKTWLQSLSCKDPLEEGKTTHSSILA